MDFFRSKARLIQNRLHFQLLSLAFETLFTTIACGASLSNSRSTSDVTTIIGKPGANELLSFPGTTVATVRDDKSYSLLLKHASGNVAKIALLDTPWDIRSIDRVSGGKLVIAQPQSGESERIYIVDSVSGRIIEDFSCEQPSISPNGQYLAFVAAYPMHFGDTDLSSDFVMLYRLDADSLQNRMKPRADFPLADFDDRMIGMQLFPKFRASINAAPSAHSKKRYYAVLSDFVWSADSTRLLFLDDQDPGAYDDAPTGNLKLSEAAARESSLLLVNVDLSHSTPVITVLPAPRCPQISGIACELDLARARIEKGRILVNEVLSGRENATKTLQIDYASFKRPTIQ